MADHYNAKNHPRVLSREKNADVVHKEFVDYMSQKAKNGRVDEEGFISYYTDLNAVLPAERESYFIEIVNKTWGLCADKTAIPEARIKQLETIIFEKIRQRTHGADDEGKTVKRIFKHFDLEGYGTIFPAQFSQALETIGCVFSKEEMTALFARFD